MRGITASLSLCLVLAAVLLSAVPAEKQITIYSRVANYSLPVSQEHGEEYVGLLELLEPLGPVTARAEKASWKLRFSNVDAEFKANSKRVRIRGRDFNLSGNFVLENGRGRVPLSSLATLLPKLLGGPVTFHESSRRLFVGDVAVHFTAQMTQTNPPTLVVNFTSPVNPMLSTEPGKLRMQFVHEPVVPPGSQTLTFGNATISSATYQEANGAAEITIATSTPLFARFTNDGRTIIIAPAPHGSTPPLQTAPTAEAGRQTPVAPPATPAPLPTPAAATPRRFFAVVDASHGGDERGAALSDTLAEKNVTLAFARRLQQELSNRGLPALLLRDGDASLSLDQRANMTNAIHPAVYICIHATSQGTGVRLYTAMVPAVANARGPFLNWDSAQSASLPGSQSAEAQIASELAKQQVPVRTLVAPLRPLNNLLVPAVAMDVAPPTPDISGLSSTTYQGIVAGSVASGILDVRGQLEAGR